MTMKAIYLTKEEELVFNKLPLESRKQWKVENEVVDYVDTDEQRKIRIELLSLNSPALQSLKKNLLVAVSDDQIKKIMIEADISQISDGDLAELFFAMGPTVPGFIILQLLHEVLAAKDIEAIHALSVIRRNLLLSLAGK